MPFAAARLVLPGAKGTGIGVRETGVALDGPRPWRAHHGATTRHRPPGSLTANGDLRRFPKTMMHPRHPW
ncbi:hypothetical protein Aglo03_38380 [Actinokineospora globicatena]|uniref:Uncharacterized protein n=1 Tax=Actinokineospora globicatena TaxID=103729 RepID=A0A9W6QQZ1_9PSEU|nr:hypothetical protein Aglo03_38380 [Actinokineospora globicatena]